MRTATALVVSLIIAALTVGLPLASSAEEPEGATIRVEIRTVKKAKGTLRVGLFDSERGFPQKPKTELGRLRSASRGVAVFTYEGLKAGRYAVSVLQDLNNNQELDTNVFGAPDEPWGTSNNITHAFSAPTYQESEFRVRDGETKVVRIELHD